MSSEIRFSGRYKIESLIMNTKLKNIYRARNVQTGELVVVKAQFFSKKKSNQLLFEGKFLQMTQGLPGIPGMYWCGTETENCNCLVIQYLGYTLQRLFQVCHYTFSLKTVVMIGIQILQMLKVYHFKELVHRNVCPRSFQFGKGKKNHKIYFNDLLNSKKYIDSKTGQHVKQQFMNISQPHTPFTSFNVLKGYQHSRRDDLQSMMLMLIYFLKGELPWYNRNKIIEKLSVQNQLLFREKKNNQEICAGLPKNFLQMLDYITHLKYSQNPNYRFLENKFMHLQKTHNLTNDYIFDWILKNIADQQIIQHPNIQESPINCDAINNEKIFLKIFYTPYQHDIEVNNIEQIYTERKFHEKQKVQIINASIKSMEEMMVQQKRDRSEKINYREDNFEQQNHSAYHPNQHQKKKKQQKCVIF